MCRAGEMLQESHAPARIAVLSIRSLLPQCIVCTPSLNATISTLPAPQCSSSCHSEGDFAMSSQFTLGIEQEFQMVDRQTGQLCPHILAGLEKGGPRFGEKIKPETLASAGEGVAGIAPDTAAARRERHEVRHTLTQLLAHDAI